MATKGAADAAVFSQFRLGEILPTTKLIENYNFNWLPAVKHFRYSPENFFASQEQKQKPTEQM